MIKKDKYIKIETKLIENIQKKKLIKNRIPNASTCLRQIWAEGPGGN